MDLGRGELVGRAVQAGLVVNRLATRPVTRQAWKREAGSPSTARIVAKGWAERARSTARTTAAVPPSPRRRASTPESRRTTSSDRAPRPGRGDGAGEDLGLKRRRILLDDIEGEDTSRLVHQPAGDGGTWDPEREPDGRVLGKVDEVA